MEYYVFLHGLGQTSAAWDEVICNFPLENFPPKNIICPSLFEMGGEADYKALLKNLENQFISYEGLHLCGISLGAVLALHYAIKYPERVKSLVLIAPQYKVPTMVIDIQNIIFRCMPKAAFQSMGVRKKDLITMSHSMRKLNFQTELWRVKCPTMILCGKKDRANKKAALNLHTEIEQSIMIQIDNAGHELNVEKPEKIAELIKGFYNEISMGKNKNLP